MTIASQSEIAQILGIDRTTLTRWQREGLPHTAGGRGRENQYSSGIVIHWQAGRRLARGRYMSPLACVLLGLALGYGTATRGEWLAQTGVLGAEMGASSEEIAKAVGFLEGAGLLPW